MKKLKSKAIDLSLCFTEENENKAIYAVEQVEDHALFKAELRKLDEYLKKKSALQYFGKVKCFLNFSSMKKDIVIGSFFNKVVSK